MQHREFHRRSIRLQGFDYRTSCAYFVTIAAYQHEDLFGLQIKEHVQLNPTGELVSWHWQNLSKLFPITLDEWIVMPDHFHGILFLENMDEIIATANNGQAGTVSGSLPAIVQNFKSLTTRKINRIQNTPGYPIWQRNYFEHIIRSDEELGNIRRYIQENPLRHFLKQDLASEDEFS